MFDFDFDYLDEVEEAATSALGQDSADPAKPEETKEEAHQGESGLEVEAETSDASDHDSLPDLIDPKEAVAYQKPAVAKVADAKQADVKPKQSPEKDDASDDSMPPLDYVGAAHKAPSDSRETLPRYWRVCGGHDSGGIIVRCKEDLFSRIVGRLQADAVIEELQRSGDRLLYTRASGEGPLTGWVSTRTGKRELLQIASDWMPTARTPNLLLHPSDESEASPRAPLEAASQNSNLIFIDWDDTLCPTSWIEQRPELKLAAAGVAGARKTGQLWYLMGEQARAVAKLVRTALSLGQVVLVTLAQRPWVKVSIKDFMPQVGDEVANLEVFYARESGWSAMPGRDPWTSMKRQAMQAALAEFEKKGNNTWDNLVSIGDSEVEKRAAKDLGRELQSSKQIRWTKTVKLTERPSVTQLTSQVRALDERLRELVNHQGDKHVDTKEWLKPS